MKLPVFLYFLAIRFTSSGCPLPGLIFDPGSLGPIRLLSYSWFRQLLDRRRGALMGRRVLFLPGGVGAAAPIHTQWPTQHNEELKMHLHPRVTRHLRCPPGRKRKKVLLSPSPECGCKSDGTKGQDCKDCRQRGLCRRGSRGRGECCIHLAPDVFLNLDSRPPVRVSRVGQEDRVGPGCNRGENERRDPHVLVIQVYVHPRGFDWTESEPVPETCVGVGVTERVCDILVVSPELTITFPVQSWNPERDILTWW